MFKNLFSVILLILLSVNTYAQWTTNTALNTSICTSNGVQNNPNIISDGSGGAIIAWVDYRSGSGDIYIQKIDGFGVAQWNANGVALCVASGNQIYPELTTDGAGGAIVLWLDARSGNIDLYAQRINASGVTQWASNGVVVCNASGPKSFQKIVSDGIGGAFISWADYRNGSNTDMYTQRINSSGVVQWLANGIPVCVVSGNQAWGRLTTNGMGGIIVTWVDMRNTTGDIYAQNINGAGVVQWNSNGIPICNDPAGQEMVAITSDGANGAIITWQDCRGGGTPGNGGGGSGTMYIYAQRVNSAGTPLWATNGVGVCIMNDWRGYPDIVTDGFNGAIIAWEDNRAGSSSSNIDIYAQHVSSNGISLWNNNGNQISSSPYAEKLPIMVYDTCTNGAIISWYDQRNGPTPYDVYVQLINSLGIEQWTSNGAAISTAGNNQLFQRLCNDGSGGAIIVWEDNRQGSDIYAQNICKTGNSGVIPSLCTPTIATISGAFTICSGSSNTYSIAPVAGATSYSWTLPNGFSGTSTTNSISTIAGSTSGSISVIASNNCFTTTIAIDFITITSSLTISVNSGTICSGDSFTLVPTGATSYTYQGGSSIVSPTVTTTYTVLGSSGGCVSNIITSTVTVNTSSITITVNSGTICPGESFTLAPTGASSYTIQGGNAVVNPTSTSTYTVIGSNGSCLSNIVTSTITVNTIVTPTITSVVVGTSATLTATGGTTYTWSTGATTPTIVISTTVNATYSVTTASGGCIGSAANSFTFCILPTPTVTASSNNIPCGSSVTLTVIGSLTYTWSTGAITNSIVITPTTTGVYTVTTGDLVCGFTTSTISVVVNSINTNLTVSPDVTIIAGSQTQLTVTGSATNYSWSPTLGLSCVTCTNPIANPLVTTQYCVLATVNTCTSQACVLVTVKESCDSNKEYGVPNAFSPNSDGKNDEFCLQGWQGCVTGFIIKIYDRWGEKVYESTDENFCWDGTYKGKLLDPAVFVFYIQANVTNAGEVTKKGNITLIK